MTIIKPILTAIVVIIVMFLLISIADIVLSVISRRFYSTAAFIVIFGVGGIFAALFGYSYGIGMSEKNTMARWIVISTIIISGILYFFLLANMNRRLKLMGFHLCLGVCLPQRLRLMCKIIYDV